MIPNGLRATPRGAGLVIVTPDVAHVRRAGPVLVAAILAIGYVILEPSGADLPAQLLRTKLFAAEGFGLWNNWWYGGHNVAGYSILFPPLAVLLTPQIVAGAAAVLSAAMFQALAEQHFGENAWLGAAWFGAGVASNLLSGRLTFALGLMLAVATALALSRGKRIAACGAALLCPLASPVAALFAALAGAAYALGGGTRAHARAGAAVVCAAIVPVLALVVAFPEGGSEPFTFAVLWPIPALALVLVLAAGRRRRILAAGTLLYALGCLAAYFIPTPVGSNAARLGEILAGPLLALLWWPRQRTLLVLAALPLIYLQWIYPVRDFKAAAGPSSHAAYYAPLLSFLERQPGPPFRIEIPFTKGHWEAYFVAPRFPLARGWERQIDIERDSLFYGGRLTATRYDVWLHQLAVRFVALSDAPLDFSAVAEARLVKHGLPYLRLVLRSRDWRVYAVEQPAPIVQGAAVLRSIGPNALSMVALHPGRALVRVHYSPYWALAGAPGCVAPAGQLTAVDLRRRGPVRLVFEFAIDRIGASSPRCTPR